MRVVLGIDIGTSSTKAILVGLDGAVLASARRSHRVDRPAQGLVEMDATVWWGETRSLIAELQVELPASDIVSVGVSGIGPCVLLSDAAGAALRPAILYGVDTRTSGMLDDVTAELGGASVIAARCGSTLSAQAAGVKLAWIARTEPEIWDQARRFTMPSSRIVELLTGEYVLDHHSASQCTPLYDVHKNSWINEWTAALAPGLEMPRLLWPGERAGSVTFAASIATGLPEGIPVVAGTIDAWAEAISSGTSGPSRMFLQYGSTMFMIVATDEARSVPGMWTTVNTAPGETSVCGGTATSGAITDWLRGLTGATWEELLAEAAESEVGARGLTILPYFAGERTPLNDPDARGVVAGLTIRHTRGDIYRAVLEATAFAVRHNVEVLRAEGVDIRSLIGAGGGVRGGLWPRIVSDVCGLDQVIPTVTIGASYGAAFLAAGIVERVSIEDWNPAVSVIESDPTATAIYDEVYADFRRLYVDTLDVVHRLAARS